MASEYKPNLGVINLTASTTINADAYAGKTITLNAAAGLTVSLPAATGSGASYKFVIGTSVTSNSYTIAANGTDIILGVLSVATDAAGVSIPSAADSDKITMNGSTTGGLVGSVIFLEDVASGVWNAAGALRSSGVEATPFATT